jgi:hypothetical protein
MFCHHVHTHIYTHVHSSTSTFKLDFIKLDFIKLEFILVLITQVNKIVYHRYQHKS